MDIIFFFAVSIIGVIMIAAFIVVSIVRTAQAPRKRLENKVNILEKEIDAIKHS